MNETQAASLKTQNANLRQAAEEMKAMMKGASRELRSAFSAEGQASSDAVGLFGGLGALLLTDAVIAPQLKAGKGRELVSAGVPAALGTIGWLAGLAMPVKSAPSFERQAGRVFSTIVLSHGIYRFGGQIVAWWQKPKALPPPSQPPVK